MALVGGVSVLRVHMTLKAQFHMIPNEGWWCANYQCQQKKQKENLIQFSEVPTHVILMNDFSEALTWTCYLDE